MGVVSIGEKREKFEELELREKLGVCLRDTGCTEGPLDSCRMCKLDTPTFQSWDQCQEEMLECSKKEEKRKDDRYLYWPDLLLNISIVCVSTSQACSPCTLCTSVLCPNFHMCSTHKPTSSPCPPPLHPVQPCCSSFTALAGAHQPT